MFQFPGFPLHDYWFIMQYRNITYGEFPHSDIRGYNRSFAAHRGFSQLVTSFFGAMYQGILPTLFVAYSYFVAASATTRFSSILFSVFKIQDSRSISLTWLFVLYTSYTFVLTFILKYLKSFFAFLYFILKLF